MKHAVAGKRETGVECVVVVVSGGGVNE